MIFVPDYYRWHHVIVIRNVFASKHYGHEIVVTGSPSP